MIIYLNLKYDTFGGNRKVLLEHVDRGLDSKGPHSDPADKPFLGLYIISSVSKW